MEREKVIEKIKKVLALAENNPNENEAVAAALKAQKLMAEFHIQENELGTEITESNIDEVICHCSGKVQKWRITLANVLAKNFRCRVFLVNNDVCFYGFEEDIKICSEVFYSMYKIGVKLSDKKKREIRKQCGTAKDVRNTFCLGFVAGIKSQLEKQCTALMIVVPKEVNEGFSDRTKGFGTKNTSLKGRGSSDIYNDGFQSGKNAILSRGIEG